MSIKEVVFNLVNQSNFKRFQKTLDWLKKSPPSKELLYFCICKQITYDL